MAHRSGACHYLTDILTKIADGHPINKIDALLPWQEKSSN
jgi:hypothetical protein